METVIREIEGKEFKFRMTRRSIRVAESNGLSTSNEFQPMTMLYALWFAGIYTEQPMSKSKADDLLDAYLDGKSCNETYETLIESLMNQYSEVF